MTKAKALNPGISIGMIPGGKVPGIDQETGAASFSGVLAAVPDLDPEVGYTVMQAIFDHAEDVRSEEHTSELQSLMRISYAVFCLQKKKQHRYTLILLISHSHIH